MELISTFCILWGLFIIVVVIGGSRG